MTIGSPPARPTLRKRYDRRRHEVIDIAAKVFAKQGFHATSITDLVEATGLASGGLYHYIQTKDDLLIAICDDLLVPMLDRGREIVATEMPPAEKLRRLMHAWLRQVAAHRDHMLVFTQERQVLQRGSQWRRIRKQRKEFEGLIDAIFAEGEQDGSMHFDDRAFMVLTLTGMVNYTPQWFNPGGRLSAEEIADRYCDLILLQARPAGEGAVDRRASRIRAQARSSAIIAGG